MQNRLANVGGKMLRGVMKASAPRWMSTLPGIDASRMIVDKSRDLKTMQPLNELKFGASFTDHMLEVDWTAEGGWEAPHISPYHALAIDPAASVLHYALECFEGMKAYKDKDGRIRMFRPDLNMNRLHRSMERLQLPSFDKDQFLECIKTLLRVEERWVPDQDGYSLYIRPTGISTHPFIGVAESQAAKLYAILSPVGPYYPEGFKPVRLYAEHRYVRAWPGGTGDAKIGGNYGPTIKPQILAGDKGFTQVLWLFGSEDGGDVTEVGTMNMFVLWKNEEGETELVTAPLDGTILPGVTRQSVLELAKEWGEFKVTERTFTIGEVARAVKEGRMMEAFGSGTAAIVSPIEHIHWNGAGYDIPVDDSLAAGPVTHRMWQAIQDIQYGRTESPWSVVI